VQPASAKPVHDDALPTAPPLPAWTSPVDQALIYETNVVVYKVIISHTGPRCAGMPLVPAVTELIVAELLYLQYRDRNKPMFLYINSTGTTRADGETVRWLIAPCAGKCAGLTHRWMGETIGSAEWFAYRFVCGVQVLCVAVLLRRAVGRGHDIF